MNRLKKSFLISILIVLAVNRLFAHGKGDIEDITVENMNSWQEQFDL